MGGIPSRGDDVVYMKATYTTKKKGGNMKKKFVISSTEFDTKDEAIAQIAEWDEDGTLDSRARVYEVKRTYQPAFSIDVKLVEVE